MQSIKGKIRLNNHAVVLSDCRHLLRCTTFERSSIVGAFSYRRVNRAGDPCGIKYVISKAYALGAIADGVPFPLLSSTCGKIHSSQQVCVPRIRAKWF